jgi:hypothetical protein
LHRIGDSEESVLALRQPADEKNSTRETDDLDACLNERVIPDAPGVIESAP